MSRLLVCGLVASLLAFTSTLAQVSLSDVVDEAKKPPAQQETLNQPGPSDTKTKTPVEPTPPPPDPPPPLPPPPPVFVIPVVIEPSIEVLPIEEEEELLPPAMPWRRVTPVDFRFGLSGTGGGLGTSAVESYRAGGILIGIGTDAWSIDGRVHYTGASLNGDLSSAFRRFWGWSGDLVLRGRVSDPVSTPGFSAVLTGRLGRFDWRYSNGVAVADPGGTTFLAGDGLRYRALLLGVGFEPLSGPGMSAVLTASGGVQQFWGETQADFENDVFETGGVFELTLDLLFRATSQL